MTMYPPRPALWSSALCVFVLSSASAHGATASSAGGTAATVVTTEVLGTRALDVPASGSDDAIRFALGWGLRLRLGFEIGGGRLRFCPRASVGFMSYPNEGSPELYRGHDVNQRFITIGGSLSYRMDLIEPFVAADVGATLYTSPGGEEGWLPGVIGGLSAGIGLRLRPRVVMGPLIGIDHPRFGGLPGFTGDPERGAFTLGLFLSFVPSSSR